MNIARDGDTRLVSLNQSVFVDDTENNKNKGLIFFKFKLKILKI